MTKKHEAKFHVAEVNMLRRMCGVIKKDRIRNEYIKKVGGLQMR